MNSTQLLQHFERIGEAPDAIPRLRRFILDLAVRGKLVEQDPTDEPAAKLLKRIEAEKARLAKTGIAGKQDPFEAPSQTDVPFPIPQTWAWVAATYPAYVISDLGKKVQTKDVLESGAFPVVDQGKVFIRGYYNDETKVIRIEAPIVLFGDHTRETKLIDFDFVVGADGVKLLQPVCLLADYYYLALQWLPLDSRGYGRHFKLLRAAFLPLPPLAEQHRIVAKVDELMAVCDQLEAAKAEREQSRDRLVAASLQRLNQPAEDKEAFREHACFTFNHLPRLTARLAHIKQLRQTILNLAVRGRLVPQDPNDEPASEILMRVEKDRAGRDWVRDTHERVPEAFTSPAGWVWTRIANAVERVTVGFVGPMKQHYVAKGVPFLRSQNVRANCFRPEGIIYISRAFHSSIMKSALSPGDVVVVRSGNVGTACSIPASLSEANCSDLVVVKRPLALVAEFLCFYLNSLASIHVEKGAVGVALTHFNTKSVATMPIVIPPLAEQRRIVAKVHELMALCDQLEQQLATTETDSRRLLEAVLHEFLAQAPAKAALPAIAS